MPFLCRGLTRVATRRDRGLVPVSGAVVLLLAAAPGSTAVTLSCPSAAAADAQVPSASGSIDRFDIVRHDIFDERGEPLSWPFRFVNRLHALTREGVIRREMLVGPGECADGEALAQTERNLRRLGFLRDARVEAVPAESGAADSVDVRVSTFDTWSLAPQLRFAKVGNRRVWTVGLSERNLLGRGQQIEMSRRSDLDRDQTVFALSDPRVFGSRFQGLASVAERSDGYRTQLQLERPFFAVTTAWGFAARIEAFDQLDPVYEGGERVADLRHVSRWLELEGARAIARTDNTAARLHVAYRSRRDDVAGDLRRSGIAEAGLSVIEHRFRRLTHVNRFERTEDFNLGHQFSSALGVSTPALGGEPGNIFFVSLSERKGMALGRGGLLVGQLRWAGRHQQGRWENALGGARVDSLSRLTSRALILTTAQYAHGANLDPEVQLTVGADSGLRGFPVRQFAGTRSLLLASEARLFVADDVKQLASFAVAAFAEGGYAWPEGRPVAMRDLRGDVGLGLLVGRNRLTTGNRVMRLDLAYAFNPAPGRGRWLFSMGAQGAFLD